MADQDRKTLSLEVCALDRASIKLDAVEVSVPGVQGVFIVLPGHAPLLSIIEIGELIAVQPNGERSLFAVNGGFTQVLENHVLVLTQTVEMDADIDMERAAAARDRAEQRLKKPDPTIDIVRAETALKRALTRIKIAERSGGDVSRKE